jgi:hypothetical protein
MISDSMYEVLDDGRGARLLDRLFMRGRINTMTTVGVERFEKGPRGALHDFAHDGDDAGSEERDVGRHSSVVTRGSTAHFLDRRRLHRRPLARPHGSAISTMRESAIPSEDAAERTLQAQLLYLARAGREQLSIAMLDDYIGPAQDKLGDRLSSAANDP